MSDVPVSGSKDVRHCEWIAHKRELVNLDDEAAQKMKQSHYDRLIFELNDRRELVLEGLGQAYSPLLKFFWFKLGREPRDNPPMQRTGAAGIVSVIRTLLGRGSGR